MSQQRYVRTSEPPSAPRALVHAGGETHRCERTLTDVSRISHTHDESRTSHIVMAPTPIDVCAPSDYHASQCSMRLRRRSAWIRAQRGYSSRDVQSPPRTERIGSLRRVSEWLVRLFSNQ